MTRPREGRRVSYLPFLIRLRGESARKDDAIFSIGHKLGVVLLELRDGMGRTVGRDSIEALGTDPSAAYLRSRDKLDELHRSGLLPFTAFPAPLGTRCLVFHHPMLAASCALLSGLYELATKELQCERVCIAIPRRDRLIVMQDLTRANRTELRRFAGEVAGRYDIDLTRELFMLDSAGPSPALTPSGRISLSETDIEIEIESSRSA